MRHDEARSSLRGVSLRTRTRYQMERHPRGEVGHILWQRRCVYQRYFAVQTIVDNAVNYAAMTLQDRSRLVRVSAKLQE